MPFSYTNAGGTYKGVAAYIRLLFTKFGLFVAIYILIGVFHNTSPPHLPTAAFSGAAFHSWVQYFISVFFWPFSFWQPTFTVGKWTVTGSITSL